MARKSKVTETREQFIQRMRDDDAEGLLTRYRAHVVKGTKTAEEWAEYEGVTIEELAEIVGVWETLSRIAQQVEDRLPEDDAGKLTNI